MSSAIYIELNNPINLKDWQSFCMDNAIKYSPNTVGRNVFYFGDTEIHFGESSYEKLPLLPNGEIDFQAARPKETANKIVVSTYWMGNLENVALVAKKILSRWNGSFKNDIELNQLMALAQ